MNLIFVLFCVRKEVKILDICVQSITNFIGVDLDVKDRIYFFMYFLQRFGSPVTHEDAMCPKFSDTY